MQLVPKEFVQLKSKRKSWVNEILLQNAEQRELEELKGELVNINEDNLFFATEM